jgi:hypothetical protein
MAGGTSGRKLPAVVPAYTPCMLVVATLFTLLAGMALAFSGLPRRHPVRWLHRATAAGLILLSLLEGVWLLAGAAAVVAAGGLLAAHLPDRDWGLAILFTHAAGGLFLLVIAGLVASMPAPGKAEAAANGETAGAAAAARPEPSLTSRPLSFGDCDPSRTVACSVRGIGSPPARGYILEMTGNFA